MCVCYKLYCLTKGIRGKPGRTGPRGPPGAMVRVCVCVCVYSMFVHTVCVCVNSSAIFTGISRITGYAWHACIHSESERKHTVAFLYPQIIALTNLWVIKPEAFIFLALLI